MMQVTAGAVAVLTVWLTLLSLQVSRLRLRHRVSFGDGGHKDLQVAIRAHGNALEQSLLFLLLLGAAESVRAVAAGPLAVIAGVFVGVRVLHGVAVFTRHLPGRQAMHVGTLVLQLGLAAAIGARVTGAV